MIAVLHSNAFRTLQFPQPQNPASNTQNQHPNPRPQAPEVSHQPFTPKKQHTLMLQATEASQPVTPTHQSSTPQCPRRPMHLRP